MASPLYLAHNGAIDCGSFWANHVDFLADARDNGKVLREVRCQNPRNPVGVQVFKLTQLCKGRPTYTNESLEFVLMIHQIMVATAAY